MNKEKNNLYNQILKIREKVEQAEKLKSVPYRAVTRTRKATIIGKENKN